MRREQKRGGNRLNKKSIVLGINAILTGSLFHSKHVLFLYASNANRYALQSTFFGMSNNNERLVYISYEQPESVIKRFEKHILNLSVISPEYVDLLKTMGGNLRIIMDVTTVNEGFKLSKMEEYLGVHQKLERFLTTNKNNIALCMFDLSRLEPESIQKLATTHDRLILNTPDITFLSGEELDNVDTTIERFVKDYLDIVVLALVSSKPMCGTDILNIVQRNFNILLSPGTIYPLLHRLKQKGLLECECSVKKKVYRPAKGSEEDIRRILAQHNSANEFLDDFLKSRCLNQSAGASMS